MIMLFTSSLSISISISISLSIFSFSPIASLFYYALTGQFANRQLRLNNFPQSPIVTYTFTNRATGKPDQTQLALPWLAFNRNTHPMVLTSSCLTSNSFNVPAPSK